MLNEKNARKRFKFSIKTSYNGIHNDQMNQVSSKLKIKNTTSVENYITIAVQTFFPFLMAGLGMVGAGIYLDKVQYWKVFHEIPQLLILVPALLGLKGNLEMTLASRLSTYANRGYLDDSNSRWKIVWANIITVEGQSMVVSFTASLVAFSLGLLSINKWNIQHFVILCVGSLLTGAIASGMLGFIMISVVIFSRFIRINPDNVATPIAASLGDFITLCLLSNISQTLYSVNTNFPWICPIILGCFLVATPLMLLSSYRNDYSKDIIVHGWFPVLTAMTFSSIGGFILNTVVSKYQNIPLFAPLMNGVGGNLVAIQASRMSTRLHTTGFPFGRLPDNHLPFTAAWKAFSPNNQHSIGAFVMLFMVVPGQLIFLLVISVVQTDRSSITQLFVLMYVAISFLQVGILLHICNWLVLYLWRSGNDPDISSIPYLTGLGDLLGTALLSFGFLMLDSFNNR